MAAGWVAEDARQITDPSRYLTDRGDRVDEVVYFTMMDDFVAHADDYAGRASGAEGGGAAPSDAQG